MALRKWVVRSLAAVVLTGCLGAGVVYQQWTNPAAVREQVEEFLRRQFPGARPIVATAHLQLLGGVVLTDLHLVRRDDADNTDFVHIPQVTVYPNKERFIDGQVTVRKIEMLRPTVHIVRDKEGKWNVEGLTGSSTASGPLPTIVIQHGTLVIQDNFAGPLAVELHELNMTLTNESPNCLTFKGSGESDAAGAVEIHGGWNRVNNAVTLSFHAAGMTINKALVQYVASQAKEERLKDLNLVAKADLDAEVIYQPDAVPALKHEIRCVLRQATVEHPMLPASIHNLSAILQCDGNKLIVEKLKAVAAETGKIEGRGWADLADPEGNCGGELTAYHFPLTKDLAERLPMKVKDLFNKFQPSGTAKIALSAERRKGKWTQCQCKFQPEDINVCFRLFKYPLERFSGVLDFDYLTDTSKWEAVGYNGDHPIKIRGAWKGSQIDADGLIEISGRGLPLDDRLINALEKDIKQQAQAFHPVGSGDFNAVIRRVPGSMLFLQTYHLHFIDCQAKWDKFPYPLEHISGDLIIQNPQGLYEFKNLHASHNGGEVFVSGVRSKFGDGPEDVKLVLNITGQNLGLDGDLKDALKEYPGLSETWDTFSPVGRLSFQTQVEQVGDKPKDKDMDVRVDVRGCAIEPSFFKYALHDVAGQFRYHKGRVDLVNFTARHGNSQLSIAQGAIDVLDNKGFYAELNDVRGNPVVADEEFIAALPKALQTTLRSVNLQDQPFAVQTKLVISRSGPATPLEPPTIFWDGQLWVQDAELKAGIDLNHVTGTLACRGLHNGKQMLGMCGNMYLSEATLFKQPVQEVRSHFVVHENTPDVMWFSLAAPMYGGDISGQGRVEFNSILRYELDLTASQVKLEEIGKEAMGPNQQLAGVAAARLHLQGQGPGVSGLEGNGSIDVPASPMTRLLNMPLLLDLLKFLGLRLPDRTAFEEAHAAFAIHGNRVAINKLDLLGSAVSLYGKGGVNLDGTDLDLDMYTGWGRAEQLLPNAVRYIPSTISKQLLKIEVRGNVGGNEGDLKFSKRPVPGLIDPFMEMSNRMMGKQTAVEPVWWIDGKR